MSLLTVHMRPSSIIAVLKTIPLCAVTKPRESVCEYTVRKRKRSRDSSTKPGDIMRLKYQQAGTLTPRKTPKENQKGIEIGSSC